MIKGQYSKYTIAEIRKGLKRFGVKVDFVYLLNTGDYMAGTGASDKDKVVKIAKEKYGAVDISDLVLGLN